MATQTAQIEAKVRGELGSRRNKRLRDAGFVPGVIYGHKEAVVPVTLPKKDVVNHINRGAHLFDLAVDGKSEKVLVKEVQYDHLGISVIHVDFARVSLDERVEVTVPIELKGEPKNDGETPGVVTQVMFLDVIFSLDSVITAVGMANTLWVMATAITIAVAIMLGASRPLAEFVQRHPTVKMLALSFLMLIGMTLIADGAGIHVPKGYIYAAIGFSVGVEALNQFAARRRRSRVGNRPVSQIKARRSRSQCG